MRSPIAVRQKAILSNTDKTSRQNVLNEASKELFRGKRHLPMLVAVSIIPPAERHPIAVEIQQPMVADRDTVGIPAQVSKHAAGITKHRLGVDHPVFPE